MILKNHPLVRFAGFRIFFEGRILSSIADKFFTLTLAWWVISDGGEDSKFHLALLMAINVLPVVLLGPAMGTFVDRFSRKRCMQVANIIRGVLIFFLVFLNYNNMLNLSLLYVMVFFISMFVPLFESAAQSSLKDLSDESAVSQVVALNSTSIYLSNILGAMLGGIMIASIGKSGAMFFNASCYVLSFVLISFVRLKHEISSERENFFKQLKEGLVYLKNTKSVFYMLIVFAFLNLFAAPLVMIIPMIVKFTLNEGASWLAAIDGSFALGAGCIAVVLSFKKNYKKVYSSIFLLLLFMGLTIIFAGITYSRWIMIVEFFIIGVCLAYVNTIAISLFQHTVPDEMKGRFFALMVSVATSVIPIAYLLNGIMIQSFSISKVLLINGSAVAMSSVLILFIPRISNNI